MASIQSPIRCKRAIDILMARYILGIDPDITASGIALYDTKERYFLLLETLSLPALVDFLLKHQSEAYDWLAVVEASWLISHVYHHGRNARTTAKIGKNVGANHQTGKHIVELLHHYGYKPVQQAPLKKMWRGRDGKITHEEFVRLSGVAFAPYLEHLERRTNQEMRDAALLALHHAPMRCSY